MKKTWMNGPLACKGWVEDNTYGFYGDSLKTLAVADAATLPEPVGARRLGRWPRSAPAAKAVQTQPVNASLGASILLCTSTQKNIRTDLLE